MAFLVKKINLNIIDEMIMLAALYKVENYMPCNKHLCFFTKHHGFMTKKIPIIDLKSQLDSVWQHQSVDCFKPLITENLNWFIESVLAALL